MTELDRTTLRRTAAFLLPLLGAYCFAVVTVTHLPWSYYAFVFGVFAQSAAMIGAGAYLVCRSAPALTGRASFWSASDALWTLFGVACLAILLPGFGAFKQLLLPERGFVFDPFLAAMGRTAFGGQSPWVITHELFGGLWPTLVLDRIYTFWSLLFMAFPMVVPFVTRDPARRAQMQIAWVLAWILIGTLAAWIFGSAGPVYYNNLVGPDPGFRALDAHLQALEQQARQAGEALSNVEFQASLLNAQASGRYAPAGGISAMPSMHVTMATLIAVAGATVSRPLGHVLAAYGVIIWLGSIHFGWHYAVDGPVAVVLMLATWRLSGAIARSLTAGATPVDNALEACAA